MTTKQFNYKSLPSFAVTDGSTAPLLTSNDKGAMIFSSTLNKPMFWDGAKWVVYNKLESVTKADIGLGSVDNVSAASLRDRATHTGTQAISTVSGLQSELDGKSAITHTHANATTSEAGFMSGADKTKLDGIATGANNYVHPNSGVTAGTYRSVTVNAAGHVTGGTNPTTIAGYGISDAAPLNHVGALGYGVHGIANQFQPGFMSHTDKIKLDSIESGANNYTYIHPDKHPATMILQDENNNFVSLTEKTYWNSKIGEIKTINGQSLVGTGNVEISTGGIDPNTVLVLNSDATFNGVNIGSKGSSTNTLLGQSSLQSNTSGYFNTAIGRSALEKNTTGYCNTSVGIFSMLENTEGYNNTALGESSLSSNIGGHNNTALGRRALAGNLSGFDNTSVGVNSLNANNDGYSNTAIGRNALTSNTNGHNNTAIGAFALRQNTSGQYNVCLGSSSLRNNQTGSSNIAIGLQALDNNISGNYNIAIGQGSLNMNNGNYNIAIGYNSLLFNTGNGNIGIGGITSSGALSSVFDIGAQNDVIAFGSKAVTNAYIQVPWTVVSDARDKINFANIPHGLEFVKQLKPTSFQFRKSRDSEETNGGVRYGFKAQEIAAIEPEGVIVDTKNPEKLYYNESNLIPVLVKAIQELSDEVERLKNATSNT